MAAAFIEDEEHIRKIVHTEYPSRHDIRALSNLLRRLIVYRELNQIASPRLNTLRLNVPVHDDLMRAAKGTDVWFFKSGCAELDARFAPMMMQKTINNHNHPIVPSQFRTTRLVKLDLFQSQKVLCINNTWLSRRETIKYAAHCASGVHSDLPLSEEDKALAQIQQALTYKQDGSGVQTIAINALMSVAPLPFEYDPNRIDAVYAELLAAAFYVIYSPDIDSLVRVIRTEFGLAAVRRPLNKTLLQS